MAGLPQSEDGRKIWKPGIHEQTGDHIDFLDSGFQISCFFRLSRLFAYLAVILFSFYQDNPRHLSGRRLGEGGSAVLLQGWTLSRGGFAAMLWHP
jgi:hypothetical protein